MIDENCLDLLLLMLTLTRAATVRPNWVLGKNIRLPACLLSVASRFSQASQGAAPKQFEHRLALLASAHRSIDSLEYNRQWRKHYRHAREVKLRFLFRTLQIGDQVY